MRQNLHFHYVQGAEWESEKPCCTHGSAVVEARQDVSDHMPLLFSPLWCLLVGCFFQHELIKT